MYAPSYVRLAALIMDIECQLYVIFGIILIPQEDKSIIPVPFAESSDLGELFKRLVSSNSWEWWERFQSSLIVKLLNNVIPTRYFLWNLNAWNPQERSRLFPKSLIFLDVALLNTMSGLKVDVLLRSGIRHIILLGYQNIFHHSPTRHKGVYSLFSLMVRTMGMWRPA